MQVDVVDGQEIHTLVAQSLYDFGLVHSPLEAGDVTSTTLATSILVCLLPKDHRLTAQERVTARDLIGENVMTLLHLRQEDEKPIAAIGGFDLVFSGKRFGSEEFQYGGALARTGAETDIDLALTVTALGAISRIEHVLVGFEDERSHYRFRLASYQSRRCGEFGFEEELSEKRRQLETIEADLANEVLEEGKKALAAA